MTEMTLSDMEQMILQSRQHELYNFARFHLEVSIC